MSDKIDRALALIREGQAAGTLGEVLDVALTNLEDEIEGRIYNKLRLGEAISDQEAVQAWLEKYAYHRLRRQIQRKARAGGRAMETLEK